MDSPLRRSGESIIIEALGQTWFFTPDVVRVLAVAGVDPQDSVRTIILDFGSKKRFNDGVYEVDTFGTQLRLTVNNDAVIVDDPYAW